MGLLITVEGGDYTGKSSVVVPALQNYFEKKGIPTLVSREPGGTPKGEEIRAEIFKKIAEGTSPLELALLFNQARKIHLDNVIIPFLGVKKENKAVVILDRYLDSTRVYQGLEYGVSIDNLQILEKKYVGSYFPDATFILYFPDEVFTVTLSERMKSDRIHTEWDKQSIETHHERQKYYRTLKDLSNKLGERRKFIEINTAIPEKNVVEQIEQECEIIINDFYNSPKQI